MDSKRPDVRLDDSPDEDGLVTDSTDDGGVLSTVKSKIRTVFDR
ncbi:hypothetical protein ACLI4Z_15450 [Natrialbaceae archaeon A-arb3/5]